jgi:hypothetical protein
MRDVTLVSSSKYTVEFKGSQVGQPIIQKKTLVFEVEFVLDCGLDEILIPDDLKTEFQYSIADHQG